MVPSAFRQRSSGSCPGIFFIGYLIFEIPSNVILQRIGARVWIARILISWGVVVIVTAAATSALQLACLRFFLGVAEAGFFPGHHPLHHLLVPEEELARAVALFMAALAVSNIIGAPLSTWILDTIPGLASPGGGGSSSSKDFRHWSSASSPGSA